MTLVLSNAEVAEVVSMKDCVDSLEDAFLELAEGRGAFRRRSDICTPSEHESGGMYALKSMDGVIPKLGVGAIRINSDILTFPEINGFLRRVKVPAAPNKRYTGLVLLFSTKTGEPLAIFPDGMIQPMRVAATSALGAKMPVARECRGGDHPRLRLAGAQPGARHLLRPQRQGDRCYSTRKEMREAFAEGDVADRDRRSRCSARPRLQVNGADIVLAATNAIVPVLNRNGLRMHASEHDQTGRVQPRGRATRRRGSNADGRLRSRFHHQPRLAVPEEPGGELQDLANEVGWKGLVTLPELLLERKHGRNVKTRRDADAAPTIRSVLPQSAWTGLPFAAVGAVILQAGQGTRARPRASDRLVHGAGNS
jgi:ornithine cyclodeaminase/alanine dehydrogenase-like protein (mu-crystallin family)